MDREIKLGDIVTDTISGFKGIVTAECDYLHGCKRFLVEPCEIKDGKILDSIWFDFQRLKYVNNSKFSISEKPISQANNDPGGPYDNPVRFYNEP